MFHIPFRSSLKKLYLTQNKFKEIPCGTVSTFKNLELLELGSNKLRDLMEVEESDSEADGPDGEQDGEGSPSKRQKGDPNDPNIASSASSPARAVARALSWLI